MFKPTRVNPQHRLVPGRCRFFIKFKEKAHLPVFAAIPLHKKLELSSQELSTL